MRVLDILLRDVAALEDDARRLAVPFLFEPIPTEEQNKLALAVVRLNVRVAEIVWFIDDELTEKAPHWRQALSQIATTHLAAAGGKTIADVCLLVADVAQRCRSRNQFPSQNFSGLAQLMIAVNLCGEEFQRRFASVSTILADADHMRDLVALAREELALERAQSTM